jgi:hypothetical protein
VEALYVILDHFGRVLDPFGAGAVGDAPERIAAHAAERKRLVHGKRAIAQLVVGGEQLDVECVAGQRAQAQEAFDGGNPGPADHDRVAVHVPSLLRRGKSPKRRVEDSRWRMREPVRHSRHA